MGYKEDSKIDIYNLHTEWAAQSSLYINYAEQFADAVAIMMRAQEKVNVVKTEGRRKIDEKKAEIDADLRNSMLSSEGKKLTETAISNAIIGDEEFIKVQDEVAKEIHEAIEAHIEAVKNKELLEGVKIGLSHRKSALENEVQLWLNGYYSDPKIPKSYKEVQQEEVKKAMEESLQTLKDRPLRRRRPISNDGE